MSAYVIPEKPETLFVWQVAVNETARGQGLAYKMIKHILARDSYSNPHNSNTHQSTHITHITHIETSITKDNAASWAMFESLAKKLNADIQVSVLFDEHTHFHGAHATEHLLRIGPIKSKI